jgi:two-component system, NarL family, response regulator LiaR
MAITLLLVDDHIVVRQGLRMLLSARDDIQIVGEANDGSQALALIKAVQPNVVLMDIQLPDMDGIEVTRRVRDLHLPCVILMLTSTVQPQFIQAAMRAGAIGYVLKTAHAHELIEAILRAAQGQRALDAMAADALLSSFAHTDYLAELTPREQEVLRLLALGQSNVELATTLTISEATVRSHVANVFSKLNLRDRAHATVFALKHGLVALDDIK